MKKYLLILSAVLFSFTISGCSFFVKTEKPATFNLPNNFKVERSGKISVNESFLLYSTTTGGDNWKAMIGPKENMERISVSSVTHHNGDTTVATASGTFYFPSIVSKECPTFDKKFIEVNDSDYDCKIKG